MRIQYVQGDATKPISYEYEIIIIPHVVNNVGAWGKGFTSSISAMENGLNRHETRYIEWAKHLFIYPPFRLGEVLISYSLQKDIHVAHMCAQNGLPGKNNPHPLDMQALDRCLSYLSGYIVAERKQQPIEIHMPKIGSGLARGNWNEIEKLINFHFIDRGISTFVYSLEKK